MNAKQTKYNGYHFRSRLEARWAVFFDSFGIKYHYEYRDFVLSDGVRYLPDFWLPDFMGGCHAEVKHLFTEPEKEKCRQLTLITGEPVLLLEGVPDYTYTVYYIRETLSGVTNITEWFGAFLRSGRMFTMGVNGDPLPAFIKQDLPDGYDFSVTQSRSARFEFNGI